MRQGDWMIDHSTGHCGDVVAILLASSGEQVEEVPEGEHSLIGAVVVHQPDDTFAVIRIEPGTLTAMQRSLH